jgi:hypothetical protein
MVAKYPIVFSVFLLLAVTTLISGQTRRTNNPETMTDEELTREAELEKLRAINRALRKPDMSEKRVIGNLQKIDCRKGIVFTVKTDSETFALESRDFDSLLLNAFVPMSGTSLVGCEADVSTVRSVMTYKEKTSAGSSARGDLISIEFVPANFRLMSKEEMAKSFAIDPTAQITDKKEQDAITRSIRRALYQPAEGEARKLGYLDRIECTSQGRYYVIRVLAKTYRLFTKSPPSAMPIRLFTRELEGMQYGCTMQPIDVPVVFIYKENLEPKLESDGEIVSIEFVPRGFSLD